MSPQQKEEMEKRFDERFPRGNDESIYRFCRLDFPEGDFRSIKSFIQSEINLAIENRDKEIVKMIKARQDLFNFVPEINGYKYIKAKDLDILSLITKDNLQPKE